ncbi:unnamed protein product [Rhodiola kirilowii]
MDPELSEADLAALNKLADDVEKLNQQWKVREESRRIEAANKAASMDERLDRMIALLEKMMPTPKSESGPELCVSRETDLVSEDATEVVVCDDHILLVESAPENSIKSLDILSDFALVKPTTGYIVHTDDFSIVSSLNKREIVGWNEASGLENLFGVLCNTLSSCLPTVCENASVYLPSFSLAHETFNGNWCSIQLFYMAVVCPNPPWKPPDDRTRLELKWMSLPMSENDEIENINEEDLCIVWKEAVTKKGVAITLESMLKIDTLDEYMAELKKGVYDLFENFARLYLLNSSVGQTAGKVGNQLLSTDAEWDLVDHSSALRHCNDGLILLVWVEKPPPLPPEIERGYRDCCGQTSMISNHAYLLESELHASKDFGLSIVYWTDYVATRWYRAPELCGSFFCKFTPSIDIWSVGCIFAEVLTGKLLIPEKSMVHQLDLITDLLRTPPAETVSGVRIDKARKYLQAMHRKQPVSFAQKFPIADPLAVQLLERMLAFDPKDRIIAEHALDHPYFKGLAKIEREPPCQPISKLEFEFERRMVTKDDVRELIFQEILEHHPILLKDYLNFGWGLQVWLNNENDKGRYVSYFHATHDMKLPPKIKRLSSIHIWDL